MCWMVAREVITPAPEGIAGTFTCRNDFFCLRGKTPALKTWHTCNFFLLVWSHESKSVPPTQRQHMWIIDAFLIVCLLPSSHTHHDVQILLASDIFKGPSWGGKTAAVCLMEGQTGPKHTAPSPIFTTKWAFKRVFIVFCISIETKKPCLNYSNFWIPSPSQIWNTLECQCFFAWHIQINNVGRCFLLLFLLCPSARMTVGAARNGCCSSDSRAVLFCTEPEWIHIHMPAWVRLLPDVSTDAAE